ncbi:hypothetical protein SAMN05216215_108614 [Saccharopolyspora shandongensis]|uniref:Uncharacterized protein n=1 Tax=Saccharopolyspora shandongensis TaxID=418495 RepID=A0A1H3TKL5_9PSEU|nr:hypothetical protein [Saccharopolyspora shandongensis]SDZ50756.1 hypothetical protein SAMN05216215_108614 [Saccharopolyspora shandongensis]
MPSTDSTMSRERVRTAKAAYQDLRERRFDHVRQVSGEESAPREWSDDAEQALLECREMQARQDWLAYAPEGPTEWWPGGWRIRRDTGVIHREGGAGGLGVWPTRDAAKQYVQDQVAGYDPSGSARAPLLWQAQVEWCAVRDDPTRYQGKLNAPVIALDEDFWVAHQV